MTFAYPWRLVLALVVVGALVWAYRAIERRTARRALAYSDLDFVLGAMRPSALPARLLLAAWTLGVALLALAIAGPHFVARVPAKDGTVVLCIDTSGSMRTPDVAPTRGEAARAAARAFIAEAPGGTKVGIVSFSGSAQLVQEPTADKDQALQAVDAIPSPDGATAIGDALALAAQAMPKTGPRVVILMTDGVNNRGAEPIPVSEAIGRQGIKLYTVGIGTSNSGQLVPGTNIEAGTDPAALRRIAENGGGTYAEAATASSLRGAFTGLAKGVIWEKKRVDGSYPFALGGGLVVLATFLTGFALGRFP